jgi:hypothetical protein
MIVCVQGWYGLWRLVVGILLLSAVCGLSSTSAAFVSAAALPADGGPVAIRGYSGRVVGGTGAYAGAVGQMVVSLTSTQTGQAPNPSNGPVLVRYAVVITFRGGKCRPTQAHRHRRVVCLALTGTLRGEAEREQERRSQPLGDQPQRIRITASSGRIARLGAVNATGEFHGTGFVPKGHRSLLLSVHAKHGDVFISAEGPTVPGFTPP